MSSTINIDQLVRGGGHTFLSKLLSIATITMTLFHISLLFIVSLSTDVSTAERNTISALLSVLTGMIILGGTAVAYLQRSLYDINTRKKLDEREAYERMRVYQASYKVLAATLFLLTFMLSFGMWAGESITVKMSREYGWGTIYGLVFSVIYLPAMVASFMNNKRSK